MQTGNEVVWKPQGPRAVLVAMVILLLPCAAVNIIYGVVHLELPIDVVFIYYSAMLVATLWLVYSFRKAVLHWCAWPNSIKVTKVGDIEKLYAVAVKKPVRREGESITDHGKRVKRWEKRARLHFMRLVDERLSRGMFYIPRKLKPDDPYKVCVYLLSLLFLRGRFWGGFGHVIYSWTTYKIYMSF